MQNLHFLQLSLRVIFLKSKKVDVLLMYPQSAPEQEEVQDLVYMQLPRLLSQELHVLWSQNYLLIMLELTQFHQEL